MRKLNVLVGAAALVVSGAAMAQFRITPGGANAGNGLFEITGTAFPTSLTTTGNSTANFRPTGTTGTDQMFASWWWFRVNGVDTREFTFGNASVAGGPTSSGAWVGDATGNLDTGGANFTVSNSTGGYSFTSQQRWQIFAGANGPAVIQTNTITNTGSSAMSISLFSYNDFDVNGTAGTDTYSHNGNWFTISDGAFTVNWAGFNSNAFQATAFATLRGLLANTAIDNLNNTVAGSPGDFTGGYQWNLEIGAGQSATVMGSFAINGDPIPTPGAAALLGLAGLVSVRRRR